MGRAGARAGFLEAKDRPLPDLRDPDVQMEILLGNEYTEIIPHVFLAGNYNPQKVAYLNGTVDDTAPQLGLVVQCSEEPSECIRARDAPLYAFEPKEDSEGRVCVGMHCFDLESKNDLLKLKDCCIQIKEKLEQQCNVLVHCQQGVDRSATVVAAFCMAYFDVSTTDARESLKRLRPACKEQLPGYEELLRTNEGRIRGFFDSIQELVTPSVSTSSLAKSLAMKGGVDRAKALFRKYDTHGSGLVSIEVLGHLLKKMANVTDHEIRAALESLVQPDGLSVLYDDFIDWVMRGPVECQGQVAPVETNVKILDNAVANCVYEQTTEHGLSESLNDSAQSKNTAPSLVTPTRTKFEVGKEVVAEIPFSEGPPLSEVRGLVGMVLGSEMTPDGRIYEVSFDLGRQPRIGISVLVNSRVGKIIFGPDEDQEFIVRFDDTGLTSDCLKKEQLTFPEAADETRSVKIPAENLRSVGSVAKSTNVQFLTIDQVLKECKRHSIPVFQRRYCWGERQCSRLWQSIDSIRQADIDANNHSIGRLMLLDQPGETRLVLDGQQRLTTITILFAALRDRLKELGGGKAGARAAAELDRLCVGRLVPTLDDRADFQRCLTEVEPAGDSALLIAKRLFFSLAKNLNVEDCKDMAKAVRRRLSAIAFVLDDERSVQRVYENLAKRAVTLDEARRMGVDLSTCTECFLDGKQTPSTHWGPDGQRLCEQHARAVGFQHCESMTPGVEMSPVDLLRNFVIEHFKSDDAMRKAHAEYWSPLEEKAGGTAEGLELHLGKFMAHQGFKLKHRWQLYSMFVCWWKGGTIPDGSHESHAIARLRELLAFKALATEQIGATT